ncbi:MAG: fibronectin type III domain-containing protein [Candidatus Methanoperedens sp.]|nr:fibronectin type III domain-containing protein [Candidatus Methanoperedens sp.]
MKNIFGRIHLTHLYPTGIAFMGFTVLGLIAILEMGFPAQITSEEQTIQPINMITPVISDLQVLYVGLISLNLSWAPAQGQAGVTDYRIYKDTFLLATVSGDLHTYKVTGLKVNTWYRFSVEACSALDNCGNGPVVGVRTLSVVESTESVINKVNNLVSTNVLSQKQGDTLIKELATIYQLDKDNIGTVIKHLQAFIDNANYMINAGVLSPEVGQPMVDTINETIKII